MSAIDRSMMTVETGSSIGSMAKPKAPPAAPDAVANALCRSRDPARGAGAMVRSATLSATSRPLEVAAAIACEAGAGSACPISSIGLPTMLVRRAARPGCSSNWTARRSAARSSGVMWSGSISMAAVMGILGLLAIHKRLTPAEVPCGCAIALRASVHLRRYRSMKMAPARNVGGAGQCRRADAIFSSLPPSGRTCSSSGIRTDGPAAVTSTTS